MARRLKNNLSKRRTRKNTLKRKGRKKYTRGGFFSLASNYKKAKQEINSLKLQIQTLQEGAQEEKNEDIEMQTLKANCLNVDQVANLKERFEKLQATHDLLKRQNEELTKTNQVFEAADRRLEVNVATAIAPKQRRLEHVESILDKIETLMQQPAINGVGVLRENIMTILNT